MNRARSLSIAAALVLTALLVAAGAGAGWMLRAVHRPYAGFRGASVVVEIPPQASAREVLGRLARAGVIESETAARAWLVWTGGARQLQAGEFRFERPASAREVLERIQRGDVLLHKVTVPEGLRLDEIARVVAAAGLGTAADLEAEFRKPGLIQAIDPAAPDLEGYLFPETYSFPKGVSAATIARAMIARFGASSGADFAARAQALGLTVRQAVTLASLIERESSVAAERPRISRVFQNRLRRKMALQCDPTVLYALHRAGKEVATLSRADLRFPSPWNTYRVGGIPPGPICSPGAESLRAAVAPAEGPELYFVAAPGGGHRFTSDLASHVRAVAQWRRYLRSSK